MSQQLQLQQIFKACLHHETVQQGEAMLNEISKSPTFLESIVSLIFRGIQDQPLLIMALTNYNNYLKTYYNNPKTPLPEQQRKLGRDTCQSLYFKICHSNVGINLYRQILYTLVAVSYPWPGLDLSNTDLVKPNAYLFAQIGRVYRYLVADQQKKILQETVNQYYPMIQKIVQQILESYNEDTSKLLNEYLTMFQHNMHLSLPNYLRDLSNLSQWLLFVKTILEAKLPEDLRDVSNNTYILNKINASKILFMVISAYTSSNSDGKQWRGWAKDFASNYASGLFQIILDMVINQKQTLNTDVLSNSIKMIYFGYKNPITRQLLMGYADSILFQHMLPMIDITDQDIELFQSTPVQFIRREEDLTANPVRRDAIDVIETLMYLSHNGKSFLMKFIEYAAASLPNPNVNMRRKDTILILIAKLKTQILKNNFLKKDFGNFIVVYFLPFLADQSPILVASCCDLLQRYLVTVELQANVTQQLVAKLYECLNHNFMVVRFKSVLAFTSLIGDNPLVIQYIRPHFGAILKIYVGLIEQIDHENLLKSLEKIIKYFDNQILAYAPQLLKHLFSLSYRHMTAEINEAEQPQSQEDDVNENVQASLCTIRQIMESQLSPSVYFDFFPDVMELLLFTLRKCRSYLEEVLSIAAVTLHKCQQLPDYVLPYLTMRQLIDGALFQTQLQCQGLEEINDLQRVDIDGEEDLLSCLKNLMVKMPREILLAYPLPKRPQLILCMIQNKLLSLQQLHTLDTSQIQNQWVGILQSYSVLVYGVGTVQNDLSLIKNFPAMISFYPWLQNIENLEIFVQIIRKVMSRFPEDQDSMEQNQQPLLQNLLKANGDQDQDDQQYVIQDQDYLEGQVQYNYLYDSPFPIRADILLVRDKISQLSPDIKQRFASFFGVNQYIKLQQLCKSPDPTTGNVN